MPAAPPLCLPPAAPSCCSGRASCGATTTTHGSARDERTHRCRTPPLSNASHSQTTRPKAPCSAPPKPQHRSGSVPWSCAPHPSASQPAHAPAQQQQPVHRQLQQRGARGAAAALEPVRLVQDERLPPTRSSSTQRHTAISQAAPASRPRTREGTTPHGPPPLTATPASLGPPLCLAPAP